MTCHICGKEAVGRCYTCGNLFCEAHGQTDCARCETGFAAGDPRPDRVTTQRLARGGRSGWWRPQLAEDYQPPACYECKGLARRRCRHCGQLYCPEHAGPNGLCAGCHHSSLVGLYALAGVLLAMGGIILVGLAFQ